MVSINTVQVPQPKFANVGSSVADLDHMITTADILEAQSLEQGHFEQAYDGILIRIYYNNGKWHMSTRSRSTEDATCPNYLRIALKRLGNVHYLLPNLAYVGILRMPELVLADFNSKSAGQIEIRLLGTYTLKRGSYSKWLEPVITLGNGLLVGSDCLEPIYTPSMYSIPKIWKLPKVITVEDALVDKLPTNVSGWVYVSPAGHRKIWTHPSFSMSLKVKNGKHHLPDDVWTGRNIPLLTWKSFLQYHPTWSMYYGMYKHLQDQIKLSP